jgi:hypothetical protein
MTKRRILLILFSLGTIGTWGIFFSRLYARHQSRGLLDLEPRVTATGEAVFDDEWFGIYMDDSKVGWHHYVLEEGNPQAGEKYLAQSESRLVFSIFGTSYPLVLQNTVSMDEELSPIRFKTVLVTPLQRVTVQGKQIEDKLSIYLRSGKVTRNTVIPLPGEDSPRLVLQETLRARLAADGIAPGREFSYTLFDPVLQLVAPIQVRILDEEEIQTAGKLEKAYPVVMEFKGIRMRWWLAEDGTTLRGESFLGGQQFREEKESSADAVADVGDTRVDLIAKSKIYPEGSVPADEFVSRLHVRLTGFDPDAFPSMGGKITRRMPDGVELVAEAGLIPLGRPLTDTERMRYLASSLSITADDRRVTELVEELRAELIQKKTPNVPSSVELARTFWSWVYRNVRKEFVIGFPTAAETIEARRGDCNEHTALLAALCRAAGMPCKAVAGVVHLNDSFYYHAWNEVCVEDEAGDAGWLPVDAAFGQWPADATHLRFVEGDPAEQTAIMSLFGSLQIAILPEGGGPS